MIKLDTEVVRTVIPELATYKALLVIKDIYNRWILEGKEDRVKAEMTLHDPTRTIKLNSGTLTEEEMKEEMEMTQKW